jgi:hypothetical protein
MELTKLTHTLTEIQRLISALFFLERIRSIKQEIAVYSFLNTGIPSYSVLHLALFRYSALA